MGAEALAPLALKMGGKLMGGGQTPASGGAPAVSPFTAGLLGPDMPEKNPNFHDEASAPPPLGGLLAQMQMPTKNPNFHGDANEMDVLDKLKAGRMAGAPGQQLDSVQASEVPPGSVPPRRAAPAQMQSDPAAATPAPGEPGGLLGDNPPDVTPQARIDPTAPVPAVTAMANPAAEPAAASGGLFGDLKGHLKTLKGKLAGSAENPLFQIGMGLLASGYDRNVNPYLAIQKGLGNIPGLQIAGAASDRANADHTQNKELEALLAQIVAGGGSKPAATPAGPASAKGLASFIPRY